MVCRNAENEVHWGKCESRRVVARSGQQNWGGRGQAGGIREGGRSSPTSVLGNRNSKCVRAHERNGGKQEVTEDRIAKQRERVLLLAFLAKRFLDFMACRCAGAKMATSGGVESRWKPKVLNAQLRGRRRGRNRGGLRGPRKKHDCGKRR